MEKLVFTNGCFDLIHPGHVDLLRRARALGSRLAVGINSDESVRSIKGNGRPVMSADERRAVLLALDSVDEVYVFDESTPERLIRKLNPDVLVKGGDWKREEIIGADFVLENGGEVLSLPLIEGFSSTGLIERIREDNAALAVTENPTVDSSLREHLSVLTDVLHTQSAMILRCAELLTTTFQDGKKVLLCGNGGSAADAQHIAAEFVGRYEAERQAMPAIALTTDTSALTALANDYNFDQIFARQIEALAVKGDCVIAISTSGNSPNVIAAVMAARRRGAKIIGMTGKNGKKLAGLCDLCVMVPSKRTARIQEAHITVGHVWCELVEASVANGAVAQSSHECS